MSKRYASLPVLATALLLQAAPLRAQTETPAETAPATTEAPAATAEAPASPWLEEVVVTARKRQESILKVPVVATALSEDQLTQFATNSLYSVSERVPGLLLGTNTASIGTQVSLRGIGTGTLNPSIDQSVSLNMDGVQMTQGTAYKSAMFDAQQIEVLKGPQALFYGKSSPGGVISVRSANPGNAFEMLLRGGYEFEAQDKRGELIISGPVSETLGLRLASMFSRSQGFFRNDAEALPGLGGRDPRYRDFAPKQEWLLRGTAVWKPLDRFQAQLKANLTGLDIEGDGGGQQYKSCPDGTGAPAGVPFLGGEDCRWNRHLRLVDMDPAAFIGIRNNGVPFSHVSQQFGSLQLDYDLTNELRLSSVSGLFSTFQSVMINGTDATAAGPAVVADTDFTREDFTQELRLSSSFSGPLNFMLGGFYQDGRMKNTNNLLGNTAIFGSAYAQLQKGYHLIDIESTSAFGQLLWRAIPTLELAGGLRWTQETRKQTQVNQITGSPVRTALGDPKLDSNNVSPEFTATYTPTDTFTLFGSYKQAYKSGSFDTVQMIAAGGKSSFGDEEVKGVEAGIKSRFFDHRLSLNVAAYQYRYSDLQVGANETDTTTGQIAIRTLNAASAKVYGLDMDASYVPLLISGLRLNAALNYNHARYDRFDNAQCWGGQTISEGCNLIPDPDPTHIDPGTGAPLFTAQDLSGRELLRAPDWSANFGFEYERPLSRGTTLSVATSTLYSSKYYTNALLRRDMIQDAYFKTSASLALRGPNQGWELALIGNNLGNKIVTGACINGNLANGVLLGGQNTGGANHGSAGVDELACTPEPGREVWLRLTLRPKAP